MRSWRLHENGDPIDKLTLDEVPDPPPPGPTEVSINIEAVGMSFPDVLQCRGEYQVRPPLPWTPGIEPAGTISALGDEVTGLMVGDRVMTLAMGGGGLTEKMNAKAAQVFVLPDSFATRKAAAIPINYGTTYFALHDRGRLQAGETLLVTGAAGGTGSAAIQLGKAAGATVIAVVGGQEKADRAKALGADTVIDHRTTPDWVDIVREASGGGVDVAYDPVGGDATHQVRRTIAWDGRLLIIGFVAGIPDLPANHMLLKNYSVVGVHWGVSVERNPASLGEQMRAVLDLADAGAVDPLLFDPYAFDDAACGLQDLADRKTWGKVVIDVG